MTPGLRKAMEYKGGSSMSRIIVATLAGLIDGKIEPTVAAAVHADENVRSVLTDSDYRLWRKLTGASNVA